MALGDDLDDGLWEPELAPWVRIISWILVALVGVLIWLVIIAAVLAVRHGLRAARPTAPVISARPSGDLRAYAPSGAVAIAWDATDRRLTVTEHVTRDTLICIRETCRLAPGWLGQ